MLGTVTPDFMLSLPKHWDTVLSWICSQFSIAGTWDETHKVLMRNSSDRHACFQDVHSTSHQNLHEISLQFHLLSALSILLSWKIPIYFPSNHSKQCGTVLAGGLTQIATTSEEWMIVLFGDEGQASVPSWRQN